MTTYAELCAKAQRLPEFKIPDLFVAPRRIAAAQWAAKWVSERLGVRRVPRSVFCKGTDATAGVWGAATPGDGGPVFVADGLSLRHTVAIAAEECHHALTLDGDETAAKAFGRAAAAAWATELLSHGAEIRQNLRGLYNRMCPSGTWVPDRASLERIAEWYGSKNTSYVTALVSAAEDLKLRLEELEMLDDAPGDPLAHLKLRGTSARAAYSWERLS